MIDKFTRNRPVLVRRFDRKVYLANSVALEKANISKGVPDPKGIIVQRNRFGEPTGILFNPISNTVESTVLVKDNINEYFSKIIPKISLEQKTAETMETLKKMSSVGVTSFCDITSDISYIDIYKSLRDSGKMTARVRYRPSLDKWKSVKEFGTKRKFQLPTKHEGLMIIIMLSVVWFAWGQFQLDKHECENEQCQIQCSK